MFTTRIWINFLISPAGDVGGFYRWLAKYSAEECAPGLATFEFTSTTIDTLKDELTADLLVDVVITTTDKVYLIYPKADVAETNKYTGVYLSGGRVHAPWDIYLAVNTGEDN